MNFAQYLALMQKAIGPHLDDNQTLFFANQLVHIKTQMLETQYPMLKARSLFPYNGEVPTYAKQYTWRQYDMIGLAKIISDHSNDIPRVDVSGEEVTTNIATIASSYGFTLDEIRASAAIAGTNLDSKKAMAARRANAQVENTLAFSGSSTRNVPGFLTTTGINEVVLAADGTGASKTWATKTADQIIRDFGLVVIEAAEVTSGIENSTVVILPVAQHALISTMRIPGTNETILSFLLKAHPQLQGIESVPELKGAGSGSTDLIVAYDRNPEKLEMIISQDYEELPPQVKGQNTEIITRQKCGGVVVYRPLSVTFASGI